MISMPVIESIRDMSRRGVSNAEIQRRTGVSQPTIRKYLAMKDFSPEMPQATRRTSILAPYKPFVDAILTEDEHVWHKQRHTATRIYERLLCETDYDGAYGTVKNYVRRRKQEMGRPEACFLELVWSPGEAQADFGDVDIVLLGEEVRAHFFVLSFPFSNMGFAQVYLGETSECVCQGLVNVFGHVGGVPIRIVLDNATGAGRRIGRRVTEAELFSRARVHYGFEVTFANPNAGHEKGNVERKVAWVRQHLLTPTPVVDDLARYNATLLCRCEEADGRREHYERHVLQAELFERDRAALIALPATSFSCVRYATAVCDKRGDVTVDGGQRYHVLDDMAKRSAIVCYGATMISFADEGGTVVAETPRRFGHATNGPDPVSQLRLLSMRPGGWRNSATRLAVPTDVAAHMDALEASALCDLLSYMARWCQTSTLEEVGAAMSEVMDRTGRMHPHDVEMTLARMSGFGIGTAPDRGPDLSIYDGMLKGGVA